MGTVLVLILGILLLSGCKADSVDYSIDDTEKGEQTEGTASLSQFADAEKWEEDLEVSPESGDFSKVHITAEITVPDMESMSVIEIREADFDAAYHEKIIKAVFGSSQVYLNEGEYVTKKQLGLAIADCEDLITYYKDMEEYTTGESFTDVITDLEDQIAGYEKQMETAPEDYIAAETYESNSYLGYLYDKLYRLDFYETEDIDGIRRKEICLFPNDSAEIYPEEMKEYDEVEMMAMEGGENLCEKSETEAKQEAEAVIEAMGFSSYVCTGVQALQWSGSDYGVSEWQISTDGYEFRFQQETDGARLTDFGTEEMYENFIQMAADARQAAESGQTVETGQSVYSLDSDISVCVTDAGIIGMTVRNPFEIIQTTQDVSLLPLATIQDIMRSALTGDVDAFRFTTSYSERLNYLPFNSMELIYFRVRDDSRENHYSYVPAWRLSRIMGDDPDNPRYHNSVIVNAIDGSVIYFSDEI